MAQHDYVIANGTGAAVRSDLNNALSAIVTQNSGSTAPATTYAYMMWPDTTAGVMKMRNGANSAWITLYQLDGEWTSIAFENGSAAAPSIYFKDSGTDTGIYSPGTDQVAITTGGTGRLFVDSSGRVGLGTSSVDELLHLKGGSAASTTVKVESTATASERSSIHFFNGSVSRGRVGGSNDFDGLTLDSSTTESAAAIRFRTGGASLTTKMTLTSGGSLGIGNTAPRGALDVTGNIFASGGSQIQITGNSGTTGLQLIGQDAAESLIGTMSSQALAFRTASTERARIDSSGRLLVGTSTSIDGNAIQVVNNVTSFRFSDNSGSSGFACTHSRNATPGLHTIVQNGDQLGYVSFRGSDGTQFLDGAFILASVDGTPGVNDMPGRLSFHTTADGASSSTERMKIGADGFVKIGTPVSPSGSASSTGFSFMEGSNFNWSTTGGNAYWNASTDTYLNFRRNGTQVGNINWSSTSTAFVTSSDYRMKENVVVLDGAIDRVKQLLPKRFNFIATPNKTVDGFLAHEAQAVVPEAVTGIKDELEIWLADEKLPEGVSVGDVKLDDDGNPLPKYQGIDQSKLVPLLTAALQEAIGRIEALEAEVAALKGA